MKRTRSIRQQKQSQSQSSQLHQSQSQSQREICCWELVTPFVRKSDRRSLRRVSRLHRSVVDECNSARQSAVAWTRKHVTPVKDARWLLTGLYIPTAFRKRVPKRIAAENGRPPYVKPSPWKISVMTMVSYLSTEVDTRSVFHCVDVIDFENPTMEQLFDLKQCVEEQSDEERCPRFAVDDETGIPYPPHPTCVETECSCLSAFFPGILDIHYEDFCRGDPLFAEVKAKKKERGATRTFANQCTMRICMGRAPNDGEGLKNGQLWNIVNLKMFRNGKIQMTGCKSIEQARGAVRFLIDRLREKAPAMCAKRDCMTQLRCFLMDANGDARATLQSVHNTRHAPAALQAHQIASNLLEVLPQEMVQCVLLTVDNESLFSCRRVCRTFRNIAESELFWKAKCEREFRCTVVKDHERNARAWFMETKFNGRFARMERLRKREYFNHPIDLYRRHRSLRRPRPFIVAERFDELCVAGEQIAMINSDFRVGFDLNLPTLTKILRREYQLQADYSPDDYPAINVKYVSPIPLPPVPELLRSSELTAEKETVIHFFIFRTGSIIINSARSLEQQTQAYNFINGVLRKHYAKVWHTHVEGKRKKKRQRVIGSLDAGSE